MLADFFTTPLTGNMFGNFRDMLVGYKNIYDHHTNIIKIKECVGTNKNKERTGHKIKVPGRSREERTYEKVGRTSQ
jgi:hypothetical protein